VIPSILAILRQTSRLLALYRLSTFDLDIVFSSECLRAKGEGSGGVPNRAILLVAGYFGAEEAGRGEEDGLLSSEKGVRDDRMGCGVANKVFLARGFSPRYPPIHCPILEVLHRPLRSHGVRPPREGLGRYKRLRDSEWLLQELRGKW
jgi:hypothetical protein